MKQLCLNYGVFLLVGILASCIQAQYRLDEISIMMRAVFDKQTEMLSKSEDIGGTSTLADLHNSFKSDDSPTVPDGKVEQHDVDGPSQESDDSPTVPDGKVEQHDVDGPSQEEWVAIFKDLSIDNMPKLLEEKNYTLHANQTGAFKESFGTYNHSYEIYFNWTSKIYMHHQVERNQTKLSTIIYHFVQVKDFHFTIGSFGEKLFFKEEGKQDVFTIWSGSAESWFFTKNLNDTYDLFGYSATTEDGNLVVKNKKTAELSYHASYLQNISNHFTLSYQDIKETMNIGKGLTHFIGSANLTTETLNVPQDVIGIKPTILLDQILQSSSRPSAPITSSKFHGTWAHEDDEYSMVFDSISNGSWGNGTASLYLKGYYHYYDGAAPIKAKEQNHLNSLLKSRVILI